MQITQTLLNQLVSISKKAGKIELPTATYADGLKFPDNCVFTSCVFGRSTTFGASCVFKGSTAFGTNNSFGPAAKFMNDVRLVGGTLRSATIAGSLELDGTTIQLSSTKLAVRDDLTIKNAQFSMAGTSEITADGINIKQDNTLTFVGKITSRGDCGDIEIHGTGNIHSLHGQLQASEDVKIKLNGSNVTLNKIEADSISIDCRGAARIETAIAGELVINNTGSIRVGKASKIDDMYAYGRDLAELGGKMDDVTTTCRSVSVMDKAKIADLNTTSAISVVIGAGATVGRLSGGIHHLALQSGAVVTNEATVWDQLTAAGSLPSRNGPYFFNTRSADNVLVGITVPHIGSVGRTSRFYSTADGYKARAGCFNGTFEELTRRVSSDRPGANGFDRRAQYNGAMALARAVMYHKQSPIKPATTKTKAKAK